MSVRWLSTESARRVGLQPSLPAGAAGAILYRFASADDGGTLHALQAEAVNAAGARLPFATAGKRPSVRGSTFTHGARVFLARDGGPGVALCESVLDALAVVRSPWGAASGEAVIAGAGTSGLQAAAVASWAGPVTVLAQDDEPSVLRAVQAGRGAVQGGPGRHDSASSRRVARYGLGGRGTDCQGRSKIRPRWRRKTRPPGRWAECLSAVVRTGWSGVWDRPWGGLRRSGNPCAQPAPSWGGGVRAPGRPRGGERKPRGCPAGRDRWAGHCG